MELTTAQSGSNGPLTLLRELLYKKQHSRAEARNNVVPILKIYTLAILRYCDDGGLDEVYSGEHHASSHEAAVAAAAEQVLMAREVFGRHLSLVAHLCDADGQKIWQVGRD